MGSLCRASTCSQTCKPAVRAKHGPKQRPPSVGELAPQGLTAPAVKSRDRHATHDNGDALSFKMTSKRDGSNHGSCVPQRIWNT